MTWMRLVLMLYFFVVSLTTSENQSLNWSINEFTKICNSEFYVKCRFDLDLCVFLKVYPH